MRTSGPCGFLRNIPGSNSPPPLQPLPPALISYSCPLILSDPLLLARLTTNLNCCVQFGQSFLVGPFSVLASSAFTEPCLGDVRGS